MTTSVLWKSRTLCMTTPILWGSRTLCIARTNGDQRGEPTEGGAQRLERGREREREREGVCVRVCERNAYEWFALSHTHFISLPLTLSFSFFLSHTYTHPFSSSLSLSHTHTDGSPTEGFRARYPPLWLMLSVLNLEPSKPERVSARFTDAGRTTSRGAL